MFNIGDDEDGVVVLYFGFMLVGLGGIFDDLMFVNVDFF